jgi:uncharacterized protein YgbK (DUF1537 family)
MVTMASVRSVYQHSCPVILRLRLPRVSIVSMDLASRNGSVESKIAQSAEALQNLENSSSLLCAKGQLS